MRARSAVWRLVAVGRSIAQGRVLALKRRGRCGINKLADWAGRVMKRNGRCERDGCGGVGMLCLRVVYVGFDWGISMATGARDAWSVGEEGPLQGDGLGKRLQVGSLSHGLSQCEARRRVGE